MGVARLPDFLKLHVFPLVIPDNLLPARGIRLVPAMHSGTLVLTAV